MTRHLHHLSWTQIRDLPKNEGVVILPVGAIEQHGPHLPVWTDTLLVTEVLNQTLAALSAEVQAWALPPVTYGKSNEHTGFAGTFSLSAATLNAVLLDIAKGVAASGFRRLVFINGHGGNMAVLDAAARDIRAETGLMTFCLHPHLYVEPPFAISDNERRLGFHAGELETSLVLALTPDLVDMSQAPTHFAQFPVSAPPLFFFGAASAAWLSRDWSSTGVFGDATLGTAEKGQQLLAAAKVRLGQLIADISRFEIPTIA
ncbi:MAG: creatininase family protein [Chloroflexi bacterium]|jgi:creatinine amidohydrolase/Fe(II)-dependent formamide hydrolase-like protein|nr:creatininase family protein [Chloroflexota bacterium]